MSPPRAGSGRSLVPDCHHRLSRAGTMNAKWQVMGSTLGYLPGIRHVLDSASQGMDFSAACESITLLGYESIRGFRRR